MIKVKGKTITLRDFSLMRDGSIVYYCENFGVKDYGFGRVLVPMNYGSKFIDEDDTGFSDFRVITGMDSVSEDSSQCLYAIDSSGFIWLKGTLGTPAGGKVGYFQSIGWYPDIKCMGVDTNSKILFTTVPTSFIPQLGRIHRGNATGGSTTTLVDTSGVDFTALGLAAGDTVYNVKDGKQFTIDAGGIAATTLTITAVVDGDFASGDNYAIIDPNWNALSYTGHSQHGLQIIEFDEDFYILDGDYLAMVSSAGVFSGQHKKLESGWIAKSGASNGDTIAIGCNKNYKGKIFFWDKHSNGWNRKISLDNEIQSIVAYKNGYIFISGNALWWTDGYTTRVLSKFLDVGERKSINVNPRGMIILQDTVFINGGMGYLSRAKNGIWTYDILKDEWTYSPYDPTASGTEKTSYEASRGILFFDSYVNYIFYSFENSWYGWTNSKILSRFWLGSGSSCGTVITNPIKLGKDARIKKIEVNLVQNLTDINNTSGKSKTLTCKLSDCTRPLWRYQQAFADSTVKNKINVYGATVSYANAQVGDEIFIQNGWNGHLRRRITAITDDGTNNEEWTLDSDLTNFTKQHTMISVMPFQIYGMDEKTITEETKMLEFYPNFYGDSVMIELGITGSSYPLIAIESIKLYYE